MIVGLLLMGQVAITDSIYSTEAVRTLISAASIANRSVPDSLRSYRARVESEVSLILQPSEGPEIAGQVEQLENLVKWLRTGEYEQRVIGYRVRAVGITMSSLSYARTAWTVPVLYGNRLSLLFGSRDTIADPVRRRNRRPRPDSTRVIAIHPLAADRDRVYRFSGGDTVALIRLRDRTVAVRRVLAQPLEYAARPITAFHGEIDIDADRFHIVRMRGRFVSVGPRPTLRGQILRSTITPVAYVELVNAEVAGEFWLPTYQRIEAQVASVMTGQGRSVFRVISRFRDYQLNDLPLAAEIGTPADTLALRPHRLSTAPLDSLQKYSEWTSELGESGREARATDYDDLAPQQWKPTGKPRLDFRVSRFSDIIRFNRVEGMYTGLGADLRFRDAFPGLSLRAHSGYAWSEKTLKGGALVELKRGRIIVAASAARQLANTNDFRPAVDGGATIPAFFASRDDYDYVDRRLAVLSARMTIGNPKAPPAMIAIASGPGSDWPEYQRLTKGVFGERYSFIQNREIHGGRYWMTSAELDVHPEATGESVTPGIGAGVRYERGDGDLDWQRLEGRVTARRNGEILTYAARFDAGLLLGHSRIPPQQLFELGGTTGLPGYDYKEFAGDRATLGRGFVMASLPFLRAPIRLGRRWFLPAPAPALSFGLQAGWTGVTDQRSATAIRELGARRDARTGAVLLSPSAEPIPLSRPTMRVRSSVDVGVRFFGGSIKVAFARPIDHHDQWRFVIGSTAW